MPKILTPTRFGNPILREVAKQLSVEEVLSTEIKSLIENIRYTLEKEEYGVGLAAPQVGKSVALSVIGIKPTPTRPDVKVFNSVIINPEITETFGRKIQLWEGCISCGAGGDTLFGKVPRYKSIRLRWIDEFGDKHEEKVTGFVAHVAQHEVDHLNGVLFVDRVKDTSSYMMADEYRKRIAKS